jgi:hypothetical protein
MASSTEAVLPQSDSKKKDDSRESRPFAARSPGMAKLFGGGG